jgi:hypothetical protein
LLGTGVFVLLDPLLDPLFQLGGDVVTTPGFCFFFIGEDSPPFSLLCLFLNERPCTSSPTSGPELGVTEFISNRRLDTGEPFTEGGVETIPDCGRGIEGLLSGMGSRLESNESNLGMSSRGTSIYVSIGEPGTEAAGDLMGELKGELGCESSNPREG